MKYFQVRQAASWSKTVALKLIKPWPKSMTTLRAIRLSKEKWQVLAEWCEHHPHTFIHEGRGETCALCHKFYRYGAGCGQCPIALKTGAEQCHYTGYARFHMSVDYQWDAALEMVKLLEELEKEERAKLQATQNLARGTDEHTGGPTTDHPGGDQPAVHLHPTFSGPPVHEGALERVPLPTDV